MNIFEILKNLYTNPKSDWILKLDDKFINPVIIQRFLVLNKASARKATILNKFAYSLSPKMYLASAWSILFFNGQKAHKAPFVRYISPNKKEHNYKQLFDKVKREFKMSDKDLQVVISFLEKEILEHKYDWFAYYGMNEKFWNDNDGDFSKMKLYGNRKKVEVKQGLDMWF